MRFTRLYYAGKLIVHSTVSLDDRQSHYLRHVLRLNDGDPVALFNGTGGEYHGQIRWLPNKKIDIQVTKYNSGIAESPLYLELGQSLLRAEKMDYVIQKSVELGVNRIVPILAERCNIKLEDTRLKSRVHHWSGIIVSACEQCGRNQLPELSAPQSLATWLSRPREGLSLICHPENKRPPAVLKKEYPTVSHATVLIGPEGGFTETEKNQALAHGFLPLSLGPRILRTETAAIVALSLLQSDYGDLDGGR